MAPTRERDIPHGCKPRTLARTDAPIALPDRALITPGRDSLRNLGLAPVRPAHSLLPFCSRPGNPRLPVVLLTVEKELGSAELRAQLPAQVIRARSHRPALAAEVVSVQRERGCRN